MQTILNAGPYKNLIENCLKNIVRKLTERHYYRKFKKTVNCTSTKKIKNIQNVENRYENNSSQIHSEYCKLTDIN